MKKTYLLLASVLLFASANAQITITSANNTPNYGETYNYLGDAATTISVTNNGANQTWDLSSVSNQPLMQILYDSANMGLDPNSFPSSNFLESSTGGESYMTITNTDFAYNGHFIPGQAKIVYTDKRELVKFPMTYLDSFSETFSGTVDNISAGQSFDRGGTVTIEATGYGDLILPYTTINDVLKITITSDYSDEMLGVTIANYFDVMTLWYSVNNNIYIANHSVAKWDGTEYSRTVNYLSQSDYVTSLREVTTVSSSFKFFPNPAHDQLTFIGDPGVELIQIMDMKGTLVKTIKITSGMQSENISDLKAGLYLIQYQSNDKSFTEKLIIQ